jgi:allantoate deiminase
MEHLPETRFRKESVQIAEPRPPLAVALRGSAERVMTRLDELASCTADAGQVTRLYLTPEHKAAAEMVRGWMSEAGMVASLDAVGNVVGRYPATSPSAKTLLIGSHIDTVRNAGKYDGCLGVVVAIEAVARLSAAGIRLPFAIEVVAFGDEEGVRFPVTLSGSRAIAGEFEAATLDAIDDTGTTLRDALKAFGCDIGAIKSLARRPEDTLGYFEVHIEQGPVLETERLPVGVVTAINGASRFKVSVTGMAGHAGTVPMGLRRDALCGAAEMVLATEDIARKNPGLVATVGRISAEPGAVNVVPGRAEFTIDLRSAVDRIRREAVLQLKKSFAAIAKKRSLKIEMTETYEEKAVACAPDFTRVLADAVESSGHRLVCLPSGAGHDGLAMARLCPIGMLFVRCAGGISHNPAEAVEHDDVEAATGVLLEFLHALAIPKVKAAA